MRHTITTTSPSSSSTTKNMGNGNKKSILTSLSADEIGKTSSTTKQLNEKDVAKWSSDDVQHWVKQQCKKFELKKTTAEKFELNGQALVLLTKHDFLRRSPEAGEVLYYALQRLINPNKINGSRLDQTRSKNNENHQHPRIVEISNDGEQSNTNYPVASSPTSYPIIEEPDDPPVIRRSQSESETNQNDERSSTYSPSHHIFAQHFHRHPMMNVAPGMAAAYFHQHHGVPPTLAFSPYQTQFVHPQFHQHYHQFLTGQGILIEIMDENEMMMTNQPTLYLVTINGQRVIMNENQVRQLLMEIQQRQQMQSAAAAAAAHSHHRK